MDWSKGYTLKVYAAIVDPSNWTDTGETVDLTSLSVKRGEDDLIQSATLDCAHYENQNEVWFRAWMDALQDGASVHVPLFTGVAAPTKRDINGSLISSSLDCYSVLKPAADVLLQKGWYAPIDMNGAELVRRLLSIGPAPVEVTDTASSPTLKSAIVAENNESHLTMANKILDTIGWTMSITGDGYIIISKKSDNIVSTYDSLFNDIVEPEVTEEADWFSCPNVFRATLNDESAIARDDDPNSILSTVSRGREIWKEENNVALNTDESLAEYARRKLKEAQQYSTKLSYKVRFNPDVNVGDIISINYPGQNLTGTFRITEQTINIDSGISVSEEATRVWEANSTSS